VNGIETLNFKNQCGRIGPAADGSLTFNASFRQVPITYQRSLPPLPETSFSFARYRPTQQRTGYRICSALLATRLRSSSAMG